MNKNSTPYSQLKIFHHPQILQKLMEKERCNPLYIRVKPTNKCNHNCAYCHYRNPYLELDEYCPDDEIPHDKMMEIVGDMKEMGVRAVTFSGGGEPLLYPYIEEAMEKILDAGIDLSIITNGSLLNGKKADLLAKAKWVRISVESADARTYCEVRGIKEHSFEQLCNNIRAFAAKKEKECELGINVVVGKENYRELKKMAVIMKELGVNHVKFAPLITNETLKYHAQIKGQVIDELGGLQRELDDEHFKIIDLYTGDFKNSVIFERQYSECPMKEFVCVIGANAKVYYCHDKAYLSDGRVCDIAQLSLKECWHSEEVSRLFQQFDAKECCKQHCVYDSRNELINSFLHMDMNHVNFI